MPKAFSGCPCAALRAGLYSASLHRAAAHLGPSGNDPLPNGKNGFRIPGKSLAILNPVPQTKVFSRGGCHAPADRHRPPAGFEQSPPLST